MNLPYHDEYSERAFVGSLILLGDSPERKDAISALSPYGYEIVMDKEHQGIVKGILSCNEHHGRWDAISIRRAIIELRLDEGLTTMAIVSSLNAVPSCANWRLYLDNCIFAHCIRMPHIIADRCGGFQKKARNLKDTMEFLANMKEFLENNLKLCEKALTAKPSCDMVEPINYPDPPIAKSNVSVGESECPI